MSETFVLNDLLTPETLTERLTAAGLSAEAVAEKAALFGQAARALVEGGKKPAAKALTFFVPGRIEVLGKHTDYGGGRSLIAAPERGFALVACPRRDGAIRIRAAATGEEAQFAIEPDLDPPVGCWSNYPMTVARRLARNFGPSLKGAEMAFASDLPPAAGMSSSSAFMVAVFLALSKINRLEARKEYAAAIDSPEALGGYLGTIENGQSFGGLAGDKGVGTFGGSEDHTAMLCCRPGALSQYTYCPVRFERTVPMPADCVFAIGASGVAAEKTGAAMAKFNRASGRLAAICRVWRERTGREQSILGEIVAGEMEAAERLRDWLAASHDSEFPPHELLDRFDHFLIENEDLVPGAGSALERGDLEEFGRLVDTSQERSERFLGNQVPETIFLARRARELGALAASAFGAGFGGSVWALVASSKAQEFNERWAADYRAEFPKAGKRSAFFLTHAGPAAFELAKPAAPPKAAREPVKKPAAGKTKTTRKKA